MANKPTLIKRTSKLPTKQELDNIKGKVEKMRKNKHKINKKSSENIKMDKKTKSLSPEDVALLIEQWHERTMKEWAIEFGVSYQTIVKMVEAVRDEDPTLCPSRKSRKEIVKAGIAIVKERNQ